MQITIITPVYNDWKNFQILVEELNLNLSKLYKTIRIIAVNDNSKEAFPKKLKFSDNIKVDILNLWVNVGHQRAIIIGLCHLYQTESESQNIIVLDSDGEDRPSDIIRMLDLQRKETEPQIIFAERSKRSEGFVFKLFYKIYKALYKQISNNEIRFGNFCSLPISFLGQIVHNSDFWNHFSSAIVKSKMPYKTIKTERGHRYSGSSKMNFNKLIIHGLSAFSLYLDLLIIKLLKISLIVIGFVISALVVLLYIKYFSSLAIPGWTSFLSAIILNISITLFFLVSILILQHLHNRNQKVSLPIDFFQKYISSIHKINEG